jgi:hypothetical protein
MKNNLSPTHNIILTTVGTNFKSTIENITQEDAKQILKALDNQEVILNSHQNDIKNKIIALNKHRGLFHGIYTAKVQAIIEKIEKIANGMDYSKLYC